MPFFTLNLNAGDYRYEWANIGHFGLGEIDNKLLIYWGDVANTLCISSKGTSLEMMNINFSLNEMILIETLYNG